MLSKDGVDKIINIMFTDNNGSRSDGKLYGKVKKLKEIIHSIRQKDKEEVIKIINEYKKTADEHPEPSEVHWCCSDIISKLK